MSKMLAVERMCTALAADNGTVYTDSKKFRSTTGFITILVTSSAAGSVTITQQCSKNNIDWYDPIDSDANALGQVIAAMGATTYYIQCSPVLAPYIRYKVVEDGTLATAVTLDLIYQEDSV